MPSQEYKKLENDAQEMEKKAQWDLERYRTVGKSIKEKMESSGDLTVRNFPFNRPSKDLLSQVIYGRDTTVELRHLKVNHSVCPTS